LTLTGVVPVEKWLKAEKGTTVFLRNAHRRTRGGIAAAGVRQRIGGQIARQIRRDCGARRLAALAT